MTPENDDMFTLSASATPLRMNASLAVPRPVVVLVVVCTWTCRVHSNDDELQHEGKAAARQSGPTGSTVEPRSPLEPRRFQPLAVSWYGCGSWFWIGE